MTNTIRFSHHNQNNARLRYTIAYTFEKNANGALDVTYGIAQCRKGDTFTRADGRKMAEARLMKAQKMAEEGQNKPKKADNPSVALYGTMSLQDYAGLSVGRIVANNFETERQNVLRKLAAIHENKTSGK